MSRDLTQYVCLNGLATSNPAAEQEAVNRNTEWTVRGKGLRKGSVAALAACGLAYLLVPALQAAGPGPRLAVEIRNYSGVPPDTLRCAETQASRIYAGAGLTIEWRELPAPVLGKEQPSSDQTAVRPVATVNLLPDSMAAQLRRRSEVFGFAAGDVAYVFTDRILAAGKEVNASIPVVLGHVMAHELGHVFLGEGHTVGGIMTSKLGPREFGRMDMGDLLFLPAQAQRMKERLLAPRAGDDRPPGRGDDTN